MADLRLSQLPIEVLVDEPDTPAFRLSQLPIEVLITPPDPIELQRWQPIYPDFVRRQTLPVACHQYVFSPEPVPNGPGQVTQVLWEAAIADVAPNEARVTQVLWEVILLRGQPLPPTTACPVPDPTDPGSTGGCPAPEFP